MRDIHVKVNEQTIELVNSPILASGGKNCTCVIVDEFGVGWKISNRMLYSVAAVFYRDPAHPYVVEPDPQHVNVYFIPEEVMGDEGNMFFGFYGIDIDGLDKVLTTEMVAYYLRKGAVVPTEQA